MKKINVWKLCEEVVFLELKENSNSPNHEQILIYLDSVSKRSRFLL